MKKRVWAAFIAMILIFSLNATVSATDVEVNYDDVILQQAIEVDSKVSAQEDFTIVSLIESSLATASLNEASAGGEKAIQSIEKENDLVKVTTIVPYKVLPTGGMVNSFTYVPVQTRSTDPVTTEFVDVTVTVTTTYAQYENPYTFCAFYRPAGVEAYWSSDNSTASVSNMTVWFDSAGELHSYPDCLNDVPLSSTLIDDYYFIRSSINRNNPVENRSYVDGSHTMPTNRVIRCISFFDHGGLVYIDLTYSVNGRSYEHDTSYYAYTA